MLYAPRLFFVKLTNSQECYIIQEPVIAIFYGGLFVKTILYLFMILTFPALAYAGDSVYLNTGEIIVGDITGENDDTITLESGNEWKDIKRSTITKIERGAAQNADTRRQGGSRQQPGSAAPDPVSAKGGGFVGPSMRAGYIIPIDFVLTDNDFDAVYEVNGPVGLGFEVLYGFKRFGIGVGIDGVSGKLKDHPSPSASFDFLAVPLTLELSNYKKYRNGSIVPYLRIQGGVGFFKPSAALLSGYVNDVTGGCGGIGAGIRGNKNSGLKNASLEVSINMYNASFNKNKVKIYYGTSRISLAISF